MLLKFFKSNLPYVVIFIPLLGIILWLPALFPDLSAKQININTQNYSPFFSQLTGFFMGKTQTQTIIALVICILQSYLLIRINFKYIFIESKTYLPAVLFLLTSSVAFNNQQLHPALLANIFFLITIDRVFLITKDRKLFKRYFESGLFIGIAALLYPPAIYSIVVMWITLFVLRSFNWRESASTIFGLVAPILIYFSISYLKNRFITDFTAYQKLLTAQTQSDFEFTNLNLTLISIFGLLFLMALFTGIRVIGTKKISSRKYYIMFLWMLILGACCFYLTPTGGIELLYFLSIPLAIVFTFFYLEIRNRFLAEIYFALMFFSIFILIWF